MPSIFTNWPTPSQEKQPQTMMLPPPCFTVFWRWRSSSFSLVFRHTRNRCLRPRSSNLLSSVHRTRFQNSTGWFAYFIANSNRFFYSFYWSMSAYMRNGCVDLLPAVSCALSGRKWSGGVIHEDSWQLFSDLFSPFVWCLHHRAKLCFAFYLFQTDRPLFRCSHIFYKASRQRFCWSYFWAIFRCETPRLQSLIIKFRTW